VTLAGPGGANYNTDREKSQNMQEDQYDMFTLHASPYRLENGKEVTPWVLVSFWTKPEIRREHR
jgi:hypothetical protein